MTARYPQLKKILSYYCRDGFSEFSLNSIRMDTNKSPIVSAKDGEHHFDENIGYHLDSELFVSYLEQKTDKFGITIQEQNVVDVKQDESGHIRHLTLDNETTLSADLFVDCTAFPSLLLHKTLNEPYISYTDSLFCDSAVNGSWERDAPALPYTVVDTMQHGWSWRIDLRDRVNRGYVYASDYCADTQAIDEMKGATPPIREHFGLFRFHPGRHQHFWVKNVVAIGNAGGCVDPLQSTELRMICQASRLVAESLVETDRQPGETVKRLANAAWGKIWDDLRWFLALHYKYNAKVQSDFWTSCREKSNLEGLEFLLDAYQSSGPSHLLETLVEPLSIFKLHGYLTLLLGQNVPTQHRNEWDETERQAIAAMQAALRVRAAESLCMPEALELVAQPQWKWPRGA